MKAATILSATEHRPWGLPSRPWAMRMQWCDLLFAHWAVPAESLLHLIPPPLQLQTFDGAAWIGVVPFRMRHVRPRFVPSVPALSFFPELNVRTYVEAEGKAGVWFFSLDAANDLAVRLARTLFHLPYMDARMRVRNDGQWIQYQSTRTHHREPPAQLTMLYRPTSEAYHGTQGTLEHWLTERYCLYAADKAGSVFRGDIHHAPWQLQRAEAEFSNNQMTQQIGIELPATQPLLHFARCTDVVAWLPERVRGYIPQSESLIITHDEPFNQKESLLSHTNTPQVRQTGCYQNGQKCRRDRE